MSFVARERRNDISSRLLCPLLFRTCSARCAFRSPARSGFLRSARPAEAAIAKVFAKIRQKILFCKFFGRAGRMGTSRTTSCQNFSLERPLAVPKTSKKRKKKSEFFKISELSFSSFLIDFRGARLFLTSKSSSSRFFALDGQILRSVRRLGLIFRFFCRPYIDL